MEAGRLESREAFGYVAFRPSSFPASQPSIPLTPIKLS
ncbi:hypothetical protein D1AOALGA4SA_12470 [Olavius algarvensis Delta 1 endosymbiont]|nr:hypothetical protein D1AOALGA4SA_12470 [Olavius algarvensis Delta 1 endosymbiont]